MGFAVVCRKTVLRSYKSHDGVPWEQSQTSKEKEKRDPSDKQHNFFDDGGCMIFVGCIDACCS